MDLATNIYGALFIGAIAIGLFYCAYGYWNDNPTFSVLLGLFGLIMAFYSIGLFLMPIISDIIKRVKGGK